MRVLLLLRGSPGCGKSTWIAENKLKNYTLCADDIRMMCSGPYLMPDGTVSINQSNDTVVWATLFRLLETRMQNGEFTVIDATNSKTSEMNRYKELCAQYKYRMFCVDFTDIPIDTVKEMNDGIPQGPLVGAALHVALAAVIAEKVSNEKQALLDLIHQYMGWVRRAIDVPPKETEPFCMFCPCYCDAAYSDSCYSCEEARNGFLGDEDSL